MIKFINISLRTRIFLSMIFLVMLASILIATVTVRQYEQHAEEYDIKRFERKEKATKKDIEIELKRRTTFPITTDNLVNIFQDRIYEIAMVHRLNISIYDMTGCLLKSSIPNAFEKIDQKQIPNDIFNALADDSAHKIIISNKSNNIIYQSSYSYMYDDRFKRIGILELRVAQNNREQEKELQNFLERLYLVYILMFLLAIVLAYLLSSYITRSIQTISEKIKETRLNKQNERITLKSESTEINSLIEAYNSMIDQLEDSASKLAQSEREQAWREMAKQVAHEIKNPLTPMRLSVQSFQRKFNPKDPDIQEKMAEHSKMLIQQIDVMSSIASAFSDFAKMPKPKREKLDIVEITKHVLDVFNKEYIYFYPKEKSIFAFLDKIQFIRIITNLVKNATQAIKEDENPKIEVKIINKKNNVKIIISDNGKGIPEENKNLIFEPKFTTKSSGMGLGLAMIKNIIEVYGGTISFNSKENIGSVFTVVLPTKI